MDHEPGAGVYAGKGRLALVRTTRTLVILRALFSDWNAKAGSEGRAIPAARKFRLVIRGILAPVRRF
ncbi:MAG: hypothetical protein LAQ30_06785 [Acidobacteriia bacterium]|nr:hypothetical protein [Terriglobia bacterium]